ncbi:MAG TPA: MFS transporter [Alphaproteobacteria bacterium]|jgi:MFS family permease|nr:MFS transporter [Alphaproteobacteria bacterium]MDP6270774.1 MFS transporter [Alphaproteobacteria bacterium]MDP7164417.1 MFS transporter [Alphaproteobacteria bacterium]MDP7428057.1 MFS transporter [Alphaproteobacteria bacterium]HJM52189.1 MFS transporter [Alphaproteobacteria bacterium]
MDPTKPNSPFGRASPRETRWGVVVVVVLAAAVAAFQVGKVPVALPLLRHDLGLSLFGAALVVAVLSAVATLVAIVVGTASDALGARRLSLLALGTIAGASLAGAFADGVAWLLLTRIFEGLGVIVLFAAGPAMILRAVSERHTRLAFAAWGSYMPLGLAAMVLLSPLLLAPLGWRGLWIVNAALAAVFAAVYLLGTRATPDPPGGAATRHLGRDLGAVLGARGPWLLALAFAAYGTHYLCVIAFLPTYLGEQHGLGAAAAAAIVGLAIAANVPGNLAAGWLLHRGASRRRLLSLAVLVMAASSVLIFQPGTPLPALVFLTTAFSGIGGLVPASLFSAVPAYAPSPALVGATSGLILQCVNMGQLAGPPIFAAVVSAWSWARAPWMFAALALAGLILAQLIGREEARALPEKFIK